MAMETLRWSIINYKVTSFENTAFFPMLNKSEQESNYTDLKVCTHANRHKINVGARFSLFKASLITELRST